jgi:hypothetical protein
LVATSSNAGDGLDGKLMAQDGGALAVVASIVLLANVCRDPDGSHKPTLYSVRDSPVCTPSVVGLSMQGVRQLRVFFAIGVYPKANVTGGLPSCSIAVAPRNAPAGGALWAITSRCTIAMRQRARRNKDH